MEMVHFTLQYQKVQNLIGWSVSINFQILASANSVNMKTLGLVKSFFGDIGNISKHNSDNTLRYTIPLVELQIVK